MRRAAKAAAKAKRKRKALPIAAAIAVVLVLVPALFFLDPGGARAYREVMQQANSSYQQGDYDSALSQLRKAEAMHHSDECLMLMADCYEAQGNLDLALEILRQMDTANSAVGSRIASLEQRRQQRQTVETLSILGHELKPDVTALSLDGEALRSEDLAQLSPLYQLESLSLRGNEIEDLSALRALGGLSSLDLSGNPVRDLEPLSALSGLRVLILDATQVEDLHALRELSNLNLLSLLDVEIGEEELAALGEELPDCAIHSGASAADAYTIRVRGQSFGSDAASLDLSGCGLRDLSALTPCTQLRRLKLSGNEISDLQPLMNLCDLQNLDLEDNRIQDLRPLMGLEGLRTLDISGNALSETAALGSLTSLSALDLGGNPLTDFSGLSRLSALETLHLESTGLDDEALQCLYPLKRLRMLALDDNPGLSDSAMSRLRSELQGCAISHSDLVYTLSFGGGRYLSNATELDMTGKGLEDLTGIEGFNCLEKLLLGHNKLESVLNLQWSGSRDKLKELDLSYNQIRDLMPLTGFTALERLDLSGNAIESLQPLMQLKSLKMLSLSDNPFPAEELEQLRAALPDCEIRFE